jgi:branched-chain amino acid transport system permease protein
MNIIVYGVLNSIVFLLMAIGFTLVYGISRLPNFAHGGLYILTGFLTWTLLNYAGLNYPLSIVLSIIIVAAIGALIYQLVLRRIRGMTISEIIASFAIGLALMEGLRWSGFIRRSYTLPAFAEGYIEIAGVPIDWQRLIIIAIGVLIVIILFLFTRYTKTGLSLRAMAQDEPASLMLGIDADRTAIIALAMGSALAGVAAVAILPLGNITVETGYSVLNYAIAVCIIGGLGSWTGTVIASFLLGFVQVLTVNFLSAQWQMIVVLLAIILVLIFRPSGLFSRQKELEERV